MTKLETELRQYLNGQLNHYRQSVAKSWTMSLSDVEDQGRIAALENTLKWLGNQPKGDSQ